ncbi:MAG: PKD domain-containing protein [Crocinitomicaceae bacterium]
MRALLIFLFLVHSITFGQMNTQGSTTGACDCYTITTTTNQAGAIWSPNSIDLTNPFDFTFEVNLGCEDTWGADGLVFVLQANGSGLGDIGNGIGYSDFVGNPTPISSNSIGIEIDTWDSGTAVPSDIADDHIGMNTGLTNTHDVVAPVAIPNIEDCAPHTFQVTWDPVTQNLEVILDGTSIFVYNGDLVTNFFAGNPNVYFGWTGATGGVSNVQSVCMYRNADFTADVTTVCENQDVTFTDNSTSDLNMITNWDWNFGDGNTSTQQNPVHSYAASGTYTAQLVMTDISGCTDVHSIDITVNPDLDIDMTSQDISCFGFADGEATATPTNGVGPYDFVWDDPATQNTQTATGLAPNTYTVEVTDVMGCPGSGTVVIAEPTELVLDSTVTIDASCGTNNGEITFYANGGTPPYSYSIDGGTSFQGSEIFTALAANTYNIVVEDDNGCSLSGTATVNSSSALVIDSLVTTDETCGQADGSITVYANDGLNPYEYSIDGGLTYQLSNVFSGLSANTYTIQVMDANSCVENATITVDSPSTLMISDIDVVNPSCNGYSDGEITLTASGGTAPYQYSIDNGVTFQSAATFTGLPAGSYDLIIQDDATCQIAGDTNLVDPAVITIDDVLIQDVSCFAFTDGELDIVASGGAGGFTYSIDNGISFQAASLFSNLPSDTYTVQVNDANGCFVNTSVTVGEPLPLLIDSVVVTDVTCNGLSDGAIEIYASQGTSPYTYSVDGVNYQNSAIFNGLSSGTVNVYVTDDNNCSASTTEQISESQPLVADMITDTIICIGGTATLCPSVTGGTAPYSYTWNGAPGPDCLVTGTSGVYSVEIEDANNCTSNTVAAEVIQYPAISLVVSPDQTICAGDEVQLIAEASGGDGGPYTFVWVNQNTMNTMNGAVQDVNPTTNTTYTVGVTDGCETPAALGDVVISTYPVPPIVITADVTNGCAPLEVNFYDSTDASLLAVTSWDFGNGEVGNGTASTQLYEEPGCYDVFAQITTTDGCVADTNLTDFICVYELPVADFSYSPDQPDLLDTEVQFENNSSGATFYEWTFGDGNSSTDVNPVNVYPEVGEQEYQVNLTVTSDAGCTDQATQYITINEVVLFYVPNTITPNGDSMNEQFRPVFIPGFAPLDYSLQVYDRWGMLLFESQNPDVGWAGTYLDQLVQDDTYVWKITFRENQSDVVHQKMGHVTVLK